MIRNPWGKFRNFQEWHQFVINSTEFEYVKKQVKKRDGWCLRCQNETGPFDTHHQSYANFSKCLLGKSDAQDEIDDCVLLCRPCHQLVHGKTKFDPKNINHVENRLEDWFFGR